MRYTMLAFADQNMLSVITLSAASSEQIKSAAMDPAMIFTSPPHHQPASAMPKRSTMRIELSTGCCPPKSSRSSELWNTLATSPI